MSSITLSPPSGGSAAEDDSPKGIHTADTDRVTQNNTTPTSSFSSESGNTGIAKRIEDFKFIKPISRGTYGKVFLGYRKDKPDVLYAIKAIRKEDLVRKNMVNSVHIERKAFCLSAADPFCVRLFYSLQTTKTVYLVMEYMIGGDLKSLLAMMGFFDLRAAAFYIAEISLALDFIHKCGVVHRDVKPDNVLIDSRGHVKLTDFGLSRVSMESDLTPRRMNNFTPGQLMSLKTEFCFPTTSPDISRSFEYQKQPEQLRGNENSISTSDIHTPVCPENGSSLLILNRRFRKPLRKLKNVENKATLPMPMRSTNMKLTPEMPKIDMREWSIIETPPERKTKCVDFGSFLNVTFEGSPSPPETELPRVIFHHSSPIDPTSATTKVPLPVFSPLLPLETPYSSEQYYYEPTENPHKRCKSGENIGEGHILNLNLKATSTTDPSHTQISSTTSERSQQYETTVTSMVLPVSPEYARRDQTHIINYMNILDHHSQLAPVKIPDLNLKKDLAGSTSSKKSEGSGSMKRKRWISSGSRSRTGISMTMGKLGLGSVNSHPGSSIVAAKFSSAEKDKSPPNGSGARIIGTPDYLAPEIIGKRGHGSPVDWWSLGICLYEFVVGCLPFSGESLNSIFHNIQTRDLEFPPDTDPAVQACIEALLDLEPENRPDLKRLRSAEFRGFFGSLPWDNMSSAEPPFVPNPSSPTDTGYFNPRNQDQNINLSQVIHPQ